MKKISVKKLLITVCLILILQNVSPQSKTEGFVYAGRSFVWGMNMGSYDLVVLFRADGTFCESLEEQEWQTKITGRYTRTKDNILMEYSDTSVENDTIFFERDEEGYEFIYYGGAQMVKMIVPDKIPEGSYSFSSASSSGGMGTGMVYVGTNSYEGYNFHKDGKFDRSSSGGVVVSGDNIGGGSSSESAGKGKYTIENGLLTLYYENGDVEKHSFFYDEDGGEEFMVAIDGSIFFYGEDREKSDEGEKQVVSQEDSNNPETYIDTYARKLMDAAKKHHGGAAIDNLKTVRAEFSVSGIEFRGLIDAERSRIRLESMNPNFPYIEQFEGNNGWIYQGNGVQPIPRSRITELQATFLTGIFGLRQQIQTRADIKGTNETDDGLLTIAMEIDGQNIGYILDKEDYEMVASVLVKENNNEITYWSDFKMVDNLLLPFAELNQASGMSTEAVYSSYLINPTFNSKDWAKP